jgi:DnaJ homolog subfamily B member 4
LPGWKSGTKKRFPNAGDEIGGGVSQDLVFVVEEKAHQTYQRVENDLHFKLRISLVDALTNPPSSTASEPSPLPRTIRALDSRMISIPLPSGIIRPGQSTRIANEGMPRRVNKVTIGKGDLIIKWFVQYPNALGVEQRRELTRVLGGSER